MINPNYEPRGPLMTPPLEWYIGMGTKADGIIIVTFDDSFRAMGNGLVGHHLEEFSHYTGNPITSLDTPERVVRAMRAIEEAEKAIKELTGFSPQLITTKAMLLTGLYRGKRLAPFAVELY